jgi:pilus assembly protein Flp/PilA
MRTSASRIPGTANPSVETRFLTVLLPPCRNATKEFEMNNLFSRVRNFLTSEDGPTAVEYAVMLALIVVVCVSVVKSLGTSISGTFSSVQSSLSGSTSGS